MLLAFSISIASSVDPSKKQLRIVILLAPAYNLILDVVVFLKRFPSITIFDFPDKSNGSDNGSDKYPVVGTGIGVGSGTFNNDSIAVNLASAFFKRKSNFSSVGAFGSTGIKPA